MAFEFKKPVNLAYLLFAEPWVYLTFGTLAALFALSYFEESNIGTVYVAFLFVDFVAYAFLKPQYNFFSVTRNSLKAAGIAIAAYVIFYAVAGLLVGSLQAQAIGIPGSQSVALEDRIATATLGSSSTIPIMSSGPVLAGLPLVTVVVFGVFIAIIETRFFTRVLEAIGQATKISFSLRDWRTYAAIAFTSIVAVVFHFQAKGVTNDVDLLVTFAFFFLSMLIVVWTREIESAGYLHMINNVAAVRHVIKGLTG